MTAPGPELQDLVNRLFDMARQGDKTLLDYIHQGVNIDLVNHEGQSFVMLAAYHGHAELVAALAEEGANVDLLNDRGQSPLAGAIFKKEDAVIDALLAAGADPQAGTPSALDTARMFERNDLVERLS
ncbi:ankyrin repeat domain-containing protein [Corynebacterium sp. HMSC04H06]|uniref:ankyrin repeat domain-containing protein n=1 Tax=Corynebacterium sp. HMSC04H06 TaxID=1581050 RepID=UPI0008A604FF|nr:ankyrin repeat domain-containing protein [Corynebacterium sp. HMSC04H06]OFS20560.1 hypothetical protein HMPREF3067_07160 [Corynebacterium sp. HMSC04H06]